jgi:hypothetical protein
MVMATKDGKTFGKFEYEQLYDFMATHPNASSHLLTTYCTHGLDMTIDEAEKAISFIKEQSLCKNACTALINGTHWVLEIFKDGERARDTGEACPWPGGTLEQALHAAGWVSRDLHIALDKAKEGLPQPNLTGKMVEKDKGYRFPGIVVSEFKTRRGKERVVVEGIGDGNDECLHIFAPDDLRNLLAPFGWVFRHNQNWHWSDEYPDHADAFTCRPASSAERTFAAAIDSR